MSDNLIISELTHADLDEAICLDPADENLRGRLCWHLYTPYALLYKAVVRDEVVGFASGVVFPGSGWVREVFVLAQHTGAAIGSELVKALVTQMEVQGAACQLVIANEHEEEMYAALGFEEDGQLLRYEGGLFLQATKDEVVHMEPEHMMAVLHMDRLATGEDREQLLREHAYLGSVYLEGTRVRGFSLPLLGHGLIVADSADVGLELQRWLLPLQPYLLLPTGHLPAHSHMITRKYTAQPAGVRMVRDERPAYRPTMFYAHP